MVFFNFNRKSAKNPQSGADHSLCSSSNQSESQGSSSDINVPTVDLAEQRLLDWKAGGVLAGGGGNTDGGAGGVAGGTAAGMGGIGGAAMAAGGVGGQGSKSNKKSPPRNYSTSPNNLILLIERGEWAAASQRATTHEHEVKQLVKLRKTTKNAGANTGAELAAASGGGGSKRNLQISNVKCKALHHACQKLRSVHTTIYQKGAASSSTEPSSSSSNTRRIIEEDEYIEACKCILALIRIHPAACSERESRHGCLPLHLCVFSMCATPPPPLPVSGSGSSGKGRRSMKNGKAGGGHHRTNSGGPVSGGGGRPPVVSSRSTSVPTKLPPPPNNNNNLNLPIQQQSNGKGGGLHRTTPSNSSADFSLGNISQMIMEESEHQQALTDHRENSKADSGSIEDRIYKNQDDVERLLLGLQSKLEMKEDKKRRDTKSGDGNNNNADGKETFTTVVNTLTPMDCLEERSRETDSTPQKSDERARAAGVAREESSSSSSFFNETQNSKMAPAAAVSSSNGIYYPNKNHNSNNNNETATSSNSSSPTYEDLQRRYLQINTKRREEYSIRVLNALLDSWPKSSKTSSEGGRLPLHMACFGKATVKVMETILKAYPDAARQRNHDGFLPIHIAAHWGVSHPDIAPLILRAYPDGAVGRNRWERTPIEEALGMAGENGRDHQLSLVWSLRRHPTYWIHNDIGSMLLPRNARGAPWRMVDVGDTPANDGNDNNGGARAGGMAERKAIGGGGAVDVDAVGSSDEEDEGVEVQMARPPSTTPHNDPAYIRALAESTDLSLLITKDKHWKAAALRCRRHPHEAREAMEVKVRGAYTAKITPLHYACENKPSVEVIRTLIEANPSALERRQEPGGQLPLHAACTWGASSDVIQTLMLARPPCAEMKDFLSNLPLHCACYSGAETVVVETLLRVYPQGVWPRNHQGSSAVDIVRRLSHPNRREVLSLLERTMSRLLERAAGAAEEGVEVADKSLEWV